MARYRPFDRAPGTELKDRAQQRQAQLDKRAGLTSKIASMASRRAAETVLAPEPVQRPPRNVERYMEALAGQPLHRLGSPEAVVLTPAYERLVRSAAEVASDGSAQVIMPWPPSRMSPSAIVSLLSIAAISSAEPVEITIKDECSLSRKRADDVRAVVFPYARSTHAQARAVQVDRHGMGEVHFDHLKRYLDGEIDAAKDYHQVLARVRKLTGRASDGRDYAEFEHPILDEIVPHGPPRGERPSNSSLLWRTRSKTDIATHKRSGDADNPSNAAYYLYTIRAGDRLGTELRGITRAPDLLILDLSRTARDRLGWNWLKHAGDMIECMRQVHPTAGILVLADDPWTYQTARFQLLGTRQTGRKSKVTPALGHVVYSPITGIVQDTNQPKLRFEGGGRIEVDGFFGDVDRNIERLRGLAHRLSEMGDPAGAETARNMIATVRRAACLPGSIADLSRFLERETSTATANDRLATYRVAADVASLSDPRSLASQADAEAQVTADTTGIMRSLERATPMSTLLADAIQPALRSSSRSAFVFRSDMVAEFAADRLSAAHPKLTERLDAGIIRVGGARVLSTITALPSSLRNQFKRAIIVAPTRSAILATLAEPWLPEQVVILADADTLAFAARDADRLAQEIGVPALAVRLRAFAARATTRVSEIGRHAVQLESEMPTDDIEFPRGSVVDLSGGSRGERRLVEISMNNGQRIIARASTAIVLRNDSAATTSFIERPAAQVRKGEEVCVIGPGFVERARTLVNVRATAAAEIREYHLQVASRFGAIAGDTVNECLRVVVSLMGEPHVSIETARYWVDLDDELDKPLHDVVPHAPHDRETFMRFTGALGIGPKLAESFWLWAVVAQRSHRLRSGNIFHDAFRGILTDPHAALASNRDRSDDIRALRAMAEEHVATVAETRSLEVT
tara:strand:- start:15529 stop:18279 length:2751 start_codon:yes stop_codon:yes gene_type:complete